MAARKGAPRARTRKPRARSTRKSSAKLAKAVRGGARSRKAKPRRATAAKQPAKRSSKSRRTTAAKQPAKRSSKPRRASVPAPPAPPAAAETLRVGSRFPDFRLPDEDGAWVSLADLLGQVFVVYFYPKDNTPGCTREACEFRDDLSLFNDAAVRVIGVSPDSAASHQRFRDQHGLNFTLLADTGHTLAEACGAWALRQRYGRQSPGIERSTFLVDADGVVRRAWRNVRVEGHVHEVLEAARQLH